MKPTETHSHSVEAGANRREASLGKTIAVNQPYIFPYLGYFQLLHAADVFVVYDDVQWINRGWINRNRMLVGGEVRYLTLPVSKPSVHRQIREYEFAPEFETHRTKIMRRLVAAYRRAPFFDEVMPLVEKCLLSEERNVARFALDSLKVWCACLGITTRFVRSSEIPIKPCLTGQERVLAICSHCEATHYVNLIGGRNLYSASLFASKDIALHFVQTWPFEYKQVGGCPFVPGLSIIDVAMNNPATTVRRLLTEYDLVGSG